MPASSGERSESSKSESHAYYAQVLETSWWDAGEMLLVEETRVISYGQSLSLRVGSQKRHPSRKLGQLIICQVILDRDLDIEPDAFPDTFALNVNLVYLRSSVPFKGEPDLHPKVNLFEFAMQILAYNRPSR